MTPEEVIGSFNPNEKAEINAIKVTAKQMIKLIQDLPNEDNRRKAIAITYIETAAMFAVKSIYS